ncbi:MAG: dual specificity protein phosphatase [Verrucomicrobiota bacterium]|nr:dual specificity protein phosphatase [Verrucomicrobiota bacterium]
MNGERLTNRDKHGATPVKNKQGRSSQERLGRLVEMVPRRIPDGFNPASISWITEWIGITAVDGVDEAKRCGCFVINVAGEIDNNADIKLPIEPRSGTVRECLDEIARNMRGAIEEQRREVVVHCAMGMERSILAVVWYLHTEAGMTLDEAYDMVSEARPIAVDRRHWIDS